MQTANHAVEKSLPPRHFICAHSQAAPLPRHTSTIAPQSNATTPSCLVHTITIAYSRSSLLQANDATTPSRRNDLPPRRRGRHGPPVRRRFGRHWRLGGYGRRRACAAPTAVGAIPGRRSCRIFRLLLGQHRRESTRSTQARHDRHRRCTRIGLHRRRSLVRLCAAGVVLTTGLGCITGAAAPPQNAGLAVTAGLLVGVDAPELAAGAGGGARFTGGAGAALGLGGACGMSSR